MIQMVWFQDIAARTLLICMIMSVLFLSFSFVIVWSKHLQKLFGAITLQMILMFSIYYTVLICTNLFHFNELVCEILAYVIQFTYLSAIWWLNSMCVDIWWTFKSIRGPVLNNDTSDLKYGWKHPKFKFYALWSYGMPCVVSVITICIEKLAFHYEDTLLHPGIGKVFRLLSSENFAKQNDFIMETNFT